MESPKTVLDVGQCNPDHYGIRMLLESLGFQVERVSLPTQALRKLKENKYSLVLVNRKIDEDYTDGVELVKSMQADSDLKKIPVMLISNLSEAQTEAVRLGAKPGFGKNDLGKESTKNLLRPFLKEEMISQTRNDNSAA